MMEYTDVVGKISTQQSWVFMLSYTGVNSVIPSSHFLDSLIHGYITLYRNGNTNSEIIFLVIKNAIFILQKIFLP